MTDDLPKLSSPYKLTRIAYADDDALTQPGQVLHCSHTESLDSVEQRLILMHI